MFSAPLGLVINEDTLGIMIPIIALIIPIVAILTKHQQQMAALMHQGQPMDERRLQELQYQIDDLRRQLAVCQAALPSPGRPQLAETPPPTPGQ